MSESSSQAMGTSDGTCMTDVIPMAHSRLLEELRQVVVLLYNEVSVSKGLPLGEGSFAMQSLCGVIEQVCSLPTTHS